MNRRAIATMVVAAIAGCGVDVDDASDERQELSGPARRPRAERIRDVAAATGLTNGVLLAGIASVETGLSHCWSEATWACRGPTSAYCGGPVIAGAADGPCSAQQGGLGMFQFDAGTYQQTLARDGVAILELDGNIAHAVDFVVNIVIRDIAGVNNRGQALAWMNAIPATPGDARFERWGALLACRYNGRCGSAAQAAKYKDATLALRNELGAAFWAGTPPPAPSGADAERVVAAANPDGRLEVFWLGAGGAIQHAAQTATAWTAPAALGGTARELAIGNNADGRLELFYLGTGDQLLHRVQLPAGGWSAEIAFGVTGRDLAVGRNADGRLELFFADAAGAIRHAWQLAPNQSWSAPAALGGTAKDLAVGANADGRLELFYIGADDRLRHRVQLPAGGWSDELAFGVTARELAVGRNADGRLELFYTTASDAIAHAWQTAPNASWSAVTALVGSAHRLAVAANADGRLELFYTTPTGALRHVVQLPTGAWSGEIGFGVDADDLAPARNADGRLELLYLGANGAPGHAWQLAPNGGWSAGGPL